MSARKKIGDGFGFRLAQAIIYTIIAVAFIITAVVMIVTKPKSFVKWMEEDRWSSYYTVRNIDVSGYDDTGKVFFEDGSGECRLALRTESTDVEVIYSFVSEDVSLRTLTFSREGANTVTVNWSDFGDYYSFEGTSEHHQAMFISFISAGGAVAVLTVLQYLFAFKGKKSQGANTCSIWFNFLFALYGGIGLAGLVGGLKGQLKLRYEEEYANSAPVGYDGGESAAEYVPEEQVAYSQPQVESEGNDTDGGVYAEEEPVEKTKIRRSDFKLDLYDTNIDERTWKDFKKTASQEELFVIALGAKYRVAHGRIKNLIYAIGIILSIALFWPTGGWSLVGYAVFSFLATKSIRYEDTYMEARSKLTKENRAVVDSYFNSNTGLLILDFIIKIAIFWITIPYQAILLLTGLFAPNFVISKNGILVSIPQGYDVGGLGAVGDYYASFSFIDEALVKPSNSGGSGDSSNDYYKRDEYTYTDSHGYEQTVYSDDGVTFYDAGGRAVGTEGKDFKIKK